MSSEYHILDEPTSKPNPLICSPFWLLLSGMLGGAWLAATLFAINGWLLRGPRWKLEVFLSVALLAGSPFILYLLVTADTVLVMPRGVDSYLGLLIIVWKLSIYYWLYFLQQSTYGLYEYFVGDSGNQRTIPIGIIYLGIGMLCRPIVVDMFQSVPWHVMVS